MSLPDAFHLEYQGLVIDGHADGLAAPRAAARQWLLGAGAAPLFAEQETELAPVALAWLAGGEAGFVGSDHPDARPVTVVRIPLPGPGA
jgi:hypothetical protein